MSLGNLKPLVTANRVCRFRSFLFLLTALVLFIVTAPGGIWAPTSLAVGQRLSQDLYAHRQVRFVSETLTEAKRREFEATVPKVYKRDRHTEDYLKALVRDLFDAIVTLCSQPMGMGEKIQNIRQKVGISVSDRCLRDLLGSNPLSLRFGERVLLTSLEAEWSRGLAPNPEEMTEARRRVLGQVDALPVSPQLRRGLHGLVSQVLLPNMVFDPEATQKARDRARNAVKPVWVTVRTGELIGRKGDLVTPLHIEKVKALSINWTALLSLLVLSLILTYGFGLFTRTFLPHIYSKNRSLTLLALVWLPTLTLFRLLKPVTGAEIAFPLVTAASLVGSILVSPLVSIFASGLAGLAVIGSSVMGWQASLAGELRLFLGTVVTGVASAFLSNELRTRAQLLEAGFLVGLLCLVLQLSIGAISGETVPLTWDVGAPLLFWSAMTAGPSPALSLAAIALLERLMGVTTVFRLMELSSPHAPLLRELAEKAPGTFQSSLIVARLAQEAARAIGADDLLTWTGALYHDIGKSIRPHYFVENQYGRATNPHDALSSQMSAKVLSLHVERGVERARQHRLPQPICDIIAQHHGTSLMTFFFQKAREEDPRVDPSQFRYKGPLPQTKEAALVMLADSVQAAVHALSNPKPEEIEEVVRQVVRERLDDGQLAETPLTLRDLEIIQRSFAETLKAIYHHRIEYPKLEAKENEITVGRHHNGGTVGTSQRAPVPQNAHPSPPKVSP